jgi:hypothetical protein
MLDRIRQISGTLLDRRSYHERMRVETAQMNGIVWKLERSQVFTEAADDPAWQAFASGDWLKSVAVFESERSDIQAEAEKYTRQGSEFRRLRIVEQPVSAYLQWELQSLKIFDESGMPIRALDASSVRNLEDSGQLPEIVIVGDEVLYEVQYDSQWSACGARRITDRDVIWQATADIAGLWAEAEPLAEYFSREIATLPPPRFG